MEKLILVFLSLLTFNIMPPVNSVPTDRMLNKVSEDQYDGPYVQYKGDYVFVNYIMVTDGAKTVKTDSIALRQKDSLSLNVRTDIPDKPFHVHLKKDLQNEKSEYGKAKKLLVLSDIEGNFGAYFSRTLSNASLISGTNWLV